MNFIVVVFVLLMNLLFNRQLGSFGTVTPFFFFFSLITGLLWSSNNRIKAFLLTVLFSFTSYIAITRSNGFVEGATNMFFFAILCSAMYLYSQTAGIYQSLSEFVFSHFIVLKLYVLGAWTSINSEKKLAFSPIIPYVIALAIGLTLILLFSGADPIYSKFTERFFNLDKNQLINRFLWSVFLFVIAIPFMYFPLRGRFTFSLNRFYPKLYISTAFIANVVVIIVMISFLIIQWPYVFVNVAYETSLSKFGVATYSEYVKRGFGEFIFIAIIIYALLWLGLIAYRLQKEIRQRRWLKISQIVIIVLFLVFLISLFRRIYLYQAYHGWSLMRIYGGLFLIIVGLLTLFLLLRHFTNRSFVRWELALGVCLYAFVGLFNAEQFIINTHPPTVNKRIDYIYLSQLSSDGRKGWKQSYQYVRKLLYDDSLLQKRVINKDDRRQIAYSAAILGNLVNRYDGLMRRYGTESELRAYLNQVVDHLLPVFERRVEKNDAGKSENQRILIQLKQYKNDLSKLPLEKIRSNVILPANFNYIHFDKSTKDYFDSFYTSYNWDDKFLFSTKSIWNQILLYNKSELEAFDYLKKKLPLPVILADENRFFVLFNKIISQPESERDYDMDTTFDVTLE